MNITYRIDPFLSLPSIFLVSLPGYSIPEFILVMMLLAIEIIVAESPNSESLVEKLISDEMYCNYLGIGYPISRKVCTETGGLDAITAI